MLYQPKVLSSDTSINVNDGDGSYHQGICLSTKSALATGQGLKL